MVLSFIAEMKFFSFLSYFCLLSLQLDMAGSLVWGKVIVLPLAGFAFLGLDSLVQGFLAVVPLVYTFKEIL